uniref:B30.2/SPRY domain-containing protein n=1 Tax=Globodera pallida TaxID=36090 RepID=A0A183C079_GLOPA
MSEKRRISIVLIFLTLIILNSTWAKGGKDGESSKDPKIGLHQKFNNLETDVIGAKQLIKDNSALILNQMKEIRAEIEKLKKKVSNLSMMNSAQGSMSGQHEPHQALQNEPRLTKSKSVSIEHYQQLSHNRNSKHNSDGTMSDEVCMSKSTNCWDPKACNKKLSIIDSDYLEVKHKGTSDMSCSVFAKSPIQGDNVDFFYYEVEMVEQRGPLFIGLANKATMSANGWVGYAPGSYAYSSSGDLFGHNVKGKIRPIDKKITFDANDIIGCGVNLKTKQIIYTKNGEPLDTTDLTVSSTDLFPCHIDNEQIAKFRN